MVMVMVMVMIRVYRFGLGLKVRKTIGFRYRFGCQRVPIPEKRDTRASKGEPHFARVHFGTLTIFYRKIENSRSLRYFKHDL